jgi:hypothetical protein
MRAAIIPAKAGIQFGGPLRPRSKRHSITPSLRSLHNRNSTPAHAASVNLHFRLPISDWRLTKENLGRGF